MYVYVYLCKYINKCMYICIYVNKYTYMYLYITYMYLYIRVCICIYMYVSCMYVCIRVCANTHILACVRRCKRAYRWSGSATGRGLSLSSSICIYVHIDKGGADLPRAGACACACVCGVCTAYILADPRDGWPCPGAPHPTSSTIRTSVHKHALLTAWASTIARHVIQCPLT